MKRIIGGILGAALILSVPVAAEAKRPRVAAADVVTPAVVNCDNNTVTLSAKGFTAGTTVPNFLYIRVDTQWARANFTNKGELVMPFPDGTHSLFWWVVAENGATNVSDYDPAVTC